MSNDILSGLTEAIRNDPQIGPRFRVIEEIEKQAADAVEFVDLSIAFSPVLLSCSDTTDDAVKVAYKGEDGRYVIKDPFRIVTEDELKLMRSRYLIVNGREKQPFIDRLRKT